MMNRVMAASVAVPLVVYAAEMRAASEGPGGAFAFTIACLLAASIALLLWTAARGAPSTGRARWLWRAQLTASAMAGVGYVGLRIATMSNGESNLLGGWALFLAPVLWLGLLAATILILPCVVTRMARL